MTPNYHSCEEGEISVDKTGISQQVHCSRGQPGQPGGGDTHTRETDGGKVRTFYVECNIPPPAWDDEKVNF